MDIKTQLKILMTLRHISMNKLAVELSNLTHETYTAAKLYGKINRDSISFTECQNIAQILGYEIVFKELDNKV